MLVTNSDVASLDALLNWWETAEYIAEAFVIMGCVGEFVAEFTKFRTEGWRLQLGKISLLVLIAALAVELGALVRTNALSGREIAVLSGLAADAGDRAGRAIERASKNEEAAAGLRMRAANLEIEAASLMKQLVAQGSRAALLYGKGRERFIEHLRPFAGQKAEIRYCGVLFTQHYVDNEAMAVAMLLQDILSAGTKWSVNPLVREPCDGTGLSVEINSKAPEPTREAANALMAALLEVPLATVGSRVNISDATRPQQIPMFDASGEEIRLTPLGVDTIIITVLAHPL